MFWPFWILQFIFTFIQGLWKESIDYKFYNVFLDQSNGDPK
jgi:hypothetical protein